MRDEHTMGSARRGVLVPDLRSGQQRVRGHKLSLGLACVSLATFAPVRAIVRPA
jgi:hypothetical protein